MDGHGRGMVDDARDNQSGPPVVAAIPKEAPADTARPVPDDQAERLARVRGLAATLGELVATVREVDERSRALERDRRAAKQEHDGAEAPATARIWQSALEPLAQYLAQAVQLAPGDRPVPLVDAVSRLEPLARTFADNALGPDGTGLHDDPARLATFEAKLLAIDPAPQWLDQEGQRLLARPELDPDVVRRSVAASEQALADDRERLRAIDDTMASLDAEWDASVSPLDGRLRALAADLTALSLDQTRSASVREEAAHGLTALKQIDLGALVSRRVNVGAWTDKYRVDREFTADQLRERINTELRPLLRGTQAAVERLEREYAPGRIEAADKARTAAVEEQRTAAVRGLITDVRGRYEALVSLRRHKLGQEPDDRFFGDIAKQVNTAITDLGALEAELLAVRDTPADHAREQGLRERTSALLARTAPYADPAELEALLTKQAEAARAEEAKLAAKARRDDILRRGRELQAERQRAKRERHEAERAAVAHAKAAAAEQAARAHAEARRQADAVAAAHTRRLAGQAELAGQVRGYLDDLRQAQADSRQRAERLRRLVDDEQRFLAQDEERLAAQKTERRTMTATEAATWLATLAATEQAVTARRGHVAALAAELAGLQAAHGQEQRIAALERQLIALETPEPAPITPPIPAVSVNPAPAPTPTEATADVVPIAVRRRA